MRLIIDNLKLVTDYVSDAPNCCKQGLAMFVDVRQFIPVVLGSYHTRFHAVYIYIYIPIETLAFY